MDKILKRVQEHYDIVVEKGYEVVGVFLQGSQNYNLHYEDSDIDTKAIIIPKFEDFCLNRKPISTTSILENDEHTDLKDVRLMFECFKKQNINFVEILFTKYKVMNPKYEHVFEKLIENNEKIARYNNYKSLNCMSGMVMEKLKALKHPYPSIKAKIDKFGYDGKQLSHCLRLLEFIKRYNSGENYSECLISNQREYLISVKKNEYYNLKDAEKICKQTANEVINIKTDYMKNNKLKIDLEVEEILQIVLIALMKLNFKNQISED